MRNQIPSRQCPPPTDSNPNAPFEEGKVQGCRGWFTEGSTTLREGPFCAIPSARGGFLSSRSGSMQSLEISKCKNGQGSDASGTNLLDHERSHDPEGSDLIIKVLRQTVRPYAVRPFGRSVNFCQTHRMHRFNTHERDHSPVQFLFCLGRWQLSRHQ